MRTCFNCGERATVLSRVTPDDFQARLGVADFVISWCGGASCRAAYSFVLVVVERSGSVVATYSLVESDE